MLVLSAALSRRAKFISRQPPSQPQRQMPLTRKAQMSVSSCAITGAGSTPVSRSTMLMLMAQMPLPFHARRTRSLCARKTGCLYRQPLNSIQLRCIWARSGGRTIRLGVAARRNRRYRRQRADTKEVWWLREQSAAADTKYPPITCRFHWRFRQMLDLAAIAISGIRVIRAFCRSILQQRRR